MRVGWGWMSGIVLVGVVALSFRAYGAGKPENTLPAAVADAIKSAFPNAENRGGNGEIDPKYGVMVYSVTLVDTVHDETGAEVKQLTMLSITDKGTLILAFRQITDSFVPPAAMDEMKKAAGDGVVKYPRRIEHFVDEKLVKYEKPKVQYEAMLITKDKVHSNIAVGENGGVIELTAEIKETDAPKVVMDAMKKAADGGEVSGLCKVETFVDEKMAKLATPRVQYAATLKKDKKFASIRVAVDGTMISQGSWR